MEKFYIPYKKNSPAIIKINGHNVLVITTDEESLSESITLDPEEVKEIAVLEDISDSPESLMRELPKEIINSEVGLNNTIQLSVVVAPPEIDVDTLLVSLHDELVWVQ